MNIIMVAEYVSAVYVAVSLVGLSRKLSDTKGADWLKYSLIVAFTFLMVDATSYLLVDPKYPFAIRYIINLLSYCLGGVTIIFTTKYVECYICEKTSVKRWIFYVPIVLSAVLIVANIVLFVSNKLVVFEDGVIVMTDDYPLWLRLVQIIALAVVPTVAVIESRKLGPRVVILLLAYYVSPVFAIVCGALTGADFTIVFASVSLVLVSSILMRDEMIATETEIVANDKLRENTVRFFALEDNFESLYDIDFETGHYEEFSKGDYYRSIVSDKLVIHTDFFMDVHKNIDAIIYEEDRENLHKLFTRENLRKELAENDHSDILYRIISDDGFAWFKMRIVYKSAEKKNVIIGVFDAENDIEVKQLVQQKLRYDTIHEIIHSGKWSFFVDANDVITSKDDAEVVQKIINNDVSDEMYAWVDIVHPDDRKAALEAFNATIADHTCKTPYDVTYRMIDRFGEYHWYHSSGRIIREPSGEGEFFGIHIDITQQMEEQKRRLLGAMPLSSDILTKANIGMWAFEIDEGKPPRMYVDETMLGLIGLDHQISPEETYYAWYNHIDEGSYDLVNDAVDRMMNGEHAEVQYPWHHPNGHTIIVRCGGVVNPGYTNGIRVEGTHQNISEMIRFDEQERERAKRLKDELVLSQLRADLLDYLADNEPDLDNAFRFFGERIIDIYHCDQIRFRGVDGNNIYLSAPGIKIVPREICSECNFTHDDNPAYGNDGVVVMNDCSKGCCGYMPLSDCPAKSSLMQRIYTGGKFVGLFSVYYFTEPHSFSESGIDAMKTVATYFGLLIGRINERKSEIARIQAESSNKAKTEFLFHMSHDIRTPMNAIIGYTNKAVKHQSEPEVLKESLDTVMISSEYLLGIVNDILDMAKIESGKLEIKESLHYGTGNRNALVEMFKVETDKKGINFRTDFNISAHYIWFDESHVKQIVANLLSNAIKYTKPGGEILYSITQYPGSKDGYGKFVATVKDTGCGMSPEFLDRIFDPFERAQSAVSSGMQGTGLGMSIAKRLCDAMGGTLEIQSEQDVGTTVTFTCEFRIPTQEEIDEYEAMKCGEVVAQSEDMSGRTILLVEDNELNRNIVIDILEDENIVVESAENGSIAVQIIKEKGSDYYDAILMDIQMPVMDGYEATRAIRELYPDSKLPIIALSANAFEEDKAASVAAGMNDHVAKPINIEVLLKTLAKHMR